MQIDLSDRQFRLLLDMVYIGNWVLNSARGEDRITDYDDLESHIFSYCLKGSGMSVLADFPTNSVRPSKAFTEGGIHEAIMDYEDAAFFDILAEELSRRDMTAEGLSPEDVEELERRIEEYGIEFDRNGLDNLTIELS